jgi:hypothetical protein
LALAVAVLHDVDLCPDQEGLQVGAQPLHVEWSVIAEIVESAEDACSSGESVLLDALAAWLRARLAIAAGAALCALGMPARHVTHPGPAWIRERIPGGSLALGFGYQSGPDDAVLPLPLEVLDHAGLDATQINLSWSRARADLEALGSAAVERDRRHRAGPLKPIRSADVVTLLGARSLRAELAAGEGDGMAALVVPLRMRGWRANSITDPAYGPAVAAAMSPQERGFERPILVTAEELSEVRPGGDPMRLLREEAEQA